MKSFYAHSILSHRFKYFITVLIICRAFYIAKLCLPTMWLDCVLQRSWSLLSDKICKVSLSMLCANFQLPREMLTLII